MSTSAHPSSPSDSPAGFESFLSETAYVPETVDEAAAIAGEAPAPDASPLVAPGVVPPELIAQALGPSFQALFRAVATSRGSHWQLQSWEKEALVNGWTPMLQLLLSKLGSSEQVMLTLALGSTAAIVGGKIAQDATRRASSTASTRTPKSEGSSASSVSAAQEKPPAPSSSWEEADE